ncbi:fumarylacetoacetate hydrolase family protein [Novosphingobium terrae]|uniref:fumarylacetoacetate hydrolase family protein n=1 Tax=Novosphingobium terrae TaxID=2726189 RepID=UPI00197DDA83|nr:fumarylacetoacetate hydrolase family protein [Novosphingobium terrae]
MKLSRIALDGKPGVAISSDQGVRVLAGADLDTAVAGGEAALRELHATVERDGVSVSEGDLRFLPLLDRSRKIICLGLNFFDHASETGNAKPAFPVIFGRFASSLIGHEAAMIRPNLSDKLDFEGEMAAIIGTAGKDIPVDKALDHVIGYSVFNDGSLRDYQMMTPQWMPGKNFDATGAFGPWLVSADELPAGGAGLMLETRLNGEVVQRASTSDMIFDVANTIALLSTFLTLEPGDVLVMGTPSGVGAARKPPLFMKPGDVVEVEIERIGLLRNPIVAE